MMLSLALVLNLFFSPMAGAWSPTGGPDLSLGRDCLPQEIEKQYLQFRGSEVERRTLLKGALSRCEGHWTHHRPRGAAAKRKMAELELEILGAEPFRVSLDSGASIEGWKIFQPFKKQAPTVILELDFEASGLDAPWVKTMYGQLVEEGGFHLIVLKNPYFSDFAKQSGSYILGGLTRGMDLYDLAYWLRVHSPFRTQITSLHLVAQGLGAHAALYALIYNDLNPIADDRKALNGVLGLCPVVNLESAIEEWEDPIGGPQEFFRGHINVLIDHIPALREAFTPFPDKIFAPWLEASLKQIGQRRNWLKPYRSFPPESRRDYLDYSNFVYQSYGIKTPAWVLGAKNDPELDWSRHGARLSAQHQDLRKSFLSVFETETGGHCDYAATHGWTSSGAWVRSFLLSESHEIWPRRDWVRTEWTQPSPELTGEEQHSYQVWGLNSLANPVLKYYVTHKCEDKNCLREFEQELSFKDLPADFVNDFVEPVRHRLHLKGPSERLIRQMNHHLHLYNEQGPLTETRKAAEFIEMFRP